MKDILIYTVTPCPYCVVAKRALDSRGIPYREVDISRTPEKRDELREQTGEWSVPQVFVDGTYIGQDDELVALAASGVLDPPEEEAEVGTEPAVAPATQTDDVGDDNRWDVGIIGGGHSGLALAAALPQGVRTVVLERMPLDAPREPAWDQARQAAVAQGATILGDEAYSAQPTNGGFEVVTLDGPVACRRVVVAVGASAPDAPLPGEEEWLGRGVSRCAECDGAFFSDRPVAVIGGDARAVAAALHMATLASEVHLLCPDAAPSAAPDALETLRTAPVVTVWNEVEVTAIIGDELPTAVVFQGRNGATQTVSVSGVFVYRLGSRPATAPLSSLVTLADDTGAVVVDADGATDTPGVYALGGAATGRDGKAMDRNDQGDWADHVTRLAKRLVADITGD